MTDTDDMKLVGEKEEEEEEEDKGRRGDLKGKAER